jgi:hypothetical protein
MAQLGDKLFAIGKIDEAIECYNKAIVSGNWTSECRFCLPYTVCVVLRYGVRTFTE